ncbi:MAG: PilN domain-containing protein [Tissierellia bacterium]|nr:PilN domain-containing protein [Tissierellia bacterium]
MKDMNFFEPYLDKQKDKNLTLSQVLIVLMALIFLAFAIFLVLRQFQISNKREYVDNLQEIAEDPTTLEKVNEVLKKEEEKIAYSASISKIRDLDQAIIAKDRINADLFIKVTEAMPDSIFLSSIQLSETGYTLTGISEDRWAIAEFQAQLEKLDGVLQVFTPNIAYNDGFFNFSTQVGFEEILPELPSEEETTDGETTDEETTDEETMDEETTDGETSEEEKTDIKVPGQDAVDELTSEPDALEEETETETEEP